MKKLSLIILSLSVLFSCGEPISSEETNGIEAAQVLGDIMAGIEEAQGASNFSFYRKNPSLSEKVFSWIMPKIMPEAQAASCFLESLSNCTNGDKTRTFNNCSIGSHTFNGSILLDYSNSACQMISQGQSVARIPNFSISNDDQGTLTVSSSTSGGQLITRTLTGFTMSVTALSRSFENTDGEVELAITTSSSSDLVITGTTRASRKLDGGTLNLSDSIAGWSATVSADSLRWSLGCSCPVSGKWTGTLTPTGSSSASDFSLSFSSCGRGTLTVGETQRTLDLERCSSI